MTLPGYRSSVCPIRDHRPETLDAAPVRVNKQCCCVDQQVWHNETAPCLRSCDADGIRTSKFQQEFARELVRDGKSISAVARTLNAHPATIYRVLDG